MEKNLCSETETRTSVVPAFHLATICCTDREQQASGRPLELAWFAHGGEGGGGWSTTPGFSPTAYAGVKLGLPVKLTPGTPPKTLYTFTLDLGYDRMASHSGFSTEISAMLPVFRFPGPQKDKTKKYLRIYAEPGAGYRSGGMLGGYASAKIMMVLFSDLRLTSTATKWSPYVEVQRRFPFSSPLQGDNRAAVGIMFAICKHCGLD
jgi:hypothetical protein